MAIGLGELAAHPTVVDGDRGPPRQVLGQRTVRGGEDPVGTRSASVPSVCPRMVIGTINDDRKPTTRNASNSAGVPASSVNISSVTVGSHSVWPVRRTAATPCPAPESRRWPSFAGPIGV